MELKEIEKIAQEYACAHNDLSHYLKGMEGELNAIKRRYRTILSRAVSKAKQRKDILAEVIEEHPELFKKPRTFIVDGIKFGIQKQKGKIIIRDEKRTLALIEDRLNEHYASVVKVSTSIDRKALGRLTGAELKKIGCEIEADTDAVLIKPIDGEIEKLINAMMADTDDDQVEPRKAA